jgi:uncharacterized membrane protein YeaQ/YmgE (transglycosylase-associated protein family)
MMDSRRRHPLPLRSYFFHSRKSEIAMGIISMIIVGLIIGLIARAIMPGDQKMGIILTIILGILGSVVAGYLGGAIGWYAPGEGAGWIGSIVGAIIVLFIYGLIARKR